MTQVENEIDFFDENLATELENELENLDKKDLIKIEIDETLENAIHEMENLKSEYNSEDAGKLIDLCKESVLETIKGQFGIASLLIDAKYGGNVTTIHNAKQKIYANESDTYNRETYEKGKYIPGENGKRGRWEGNSQGQKFSGDSSNSVGSNYTRSQLDKNGNLVSEYTGKTIKGSDSSPDHIYSLSEFHKNGGYMLSDKEKCDFGTDTNNLASVERNINQSLRDKDKKEWMDEKASGRDVTNEDYFEIDRERVDAAVRRGQETANKHLPTNKQKVAYYTKNLVKSGAKDAGKMAAYSAIGVIMHDLTVALVEELKFVLKNHGNKSFKELFVHFKEKMSQVIEGIKAKWKDILSGSLEAGITAFLSNILVFVINLFLTTASKIVSMIRAGFVSICQAIKLMAHHPEDMTQEEANFQASKILVTGIIGALSLGLSAAIEKFLQAIPGLQPIMMFPIPMLGSDKNGQRTVSDVLAVTLSAIAGALVSTIVVYFMDKCKQDAKNTKLQIQMITTSGVIINCKVSESWCVLDDAYDFFRESMQEDMRVVSEAYAEIQESSRMVKEGLKDWDEIKERMNRLKEMHS